MGTAYYNSDISLTSFYLHHSVAAVHSTYHEHFAPYLSIDVFYSPQFEYVGANNISICFIVFLSTFSLESLSTTFMILFVASVLT